MKCNNLKYGVLAVALAMGVSACDNFLDRPTIDNYNTSNYYETDDQCISGVNYLYNSPWYDFQRGFIKVGEVLSGNYYWGSSPYLTFTVNGTDQDLVNMSYSLWAVIGHANTVYDNIKGTTPYCVKRVAVLNCWGKMRAWGCHMVHHALYQKQNYSYAGVIEALSGAPFDVQFISFEDIKNDPHVLDGVDVLINVGDADTAHTGGIWWEDADVSSAIRRFVWNGGGFIGVGEPGGHQYQGRFLQTAGILGVEKETGFTLNYDKYNWDEHRDHFILADCPDRDMDFGEGKKSIYALEGTEILIQRAAGCPTALSTAGCSTAPFCGAPTARRSCTPGSAPTATWKCTPTSKTASTVW